MQKVGGPSGRAPEAQQEQPLTIQHLIDAQAARPRISLYEEKGQWSESGELKSLYTEIPLMSISGHHVAITGKDGKVNYIKTHVDLYLCGKTGSVFYMLRPFEDGEKVSDSTQANQGTDDTQKEETEPPSNDDTDGK